MQRKTINLPNYYKLFHVQFFAKWFGIDDDTYNVVRWELQDGESAPAEKTEIGDAPQFVFDF